jgi:hypothetical protein
MVSLSGLNAKPGACTFVKCTLLIDQDTEQLAFTECVFKNCNQRGLYAFLLMGDGKNYLARRFEFEKRLALARSKAKSLISSKNPPASRAGAGREPPVPKLTRSADIKLNKRVSLRRHAKALASSSRTCPTSGHV